LQGNKPASTQYWQVFSFLLNHIFLINRQSRRGKFYQIIQVKSTTGGRLEKKVRAGTWYRSKVIDHSKMVVTGAEPI